jgi:hypothetical protein
VADMPAEERSNSGGVLSPDYCLGSDCDYDINNPADRDYSDIREQVMSREDQLDPSKPYEWDDYSEWLKAVKQEYAEGREKSGQQRADRDQKAREQFATARNGCSAKANSEEQMHEFRESRNSCISAAKDAYDDALASSKEQYEEEIESVEERRCTIWEEELGAKSIKHEMTQRECDFMKQVKLRNCNAEIEENIRNRVFLRFSSVQSRNSRIYNEVEHRLSPRDIRRLASGNRIYMHLRMTRYSSLAMSEASRLTGEYIACKRTNAAEQERVRSSEYVAKKMSICSDALTFNNHRVTAQGKVKTLGCDQSGEGSTL